MRCAVARWARRLPRRRARRRGRSSSCRGSGCWPRRCVSPACRRRRRSSGCPRRPPGRTTSRSSEILPLGRYLANSLLIAGLAVPLTVLVASWAGFAMAQLPAAVRGPRCWRSPWSCAWCRSPRCGSRDSSCCGELALVDTLRRAAGAGVDGLEPVLRADLLLGVSPPAGGAHRGGAARGARCAPHLGRDRDAAREARDRGRGAPHVRAVLERLHEPAAVREVRRALDAARWASACCSRWTRRTGRCSWRAPWS